MGGSGSGSGSGFRQHRRGGRGPDFGQDSAGVRHPRSERRPAILAFARCGVAAAVLLSCCVPAWGAVKGMRDVKEMGATRGSKIPDMEALAKHPYGHGPNQKALLDTRILDEVFLMDSQGSQQGPTTDSQAMLERWSRDVPVGSCMGAPERLRKAVWISGAWQHALEELQRVKRERKEYEMIEGCSVVADEAARRTWESSKKLAELGCFVGLDGEAGHPTRRPTMVRYAHGLYVNTTTGSWYDSRPPRRPGKAKAPTPPPEDIFGGRSRVA